MSIDNSGDQFVDQQEYIGKELSVPSNTFNLLGKQFDLISVIIYSIGIIILTILYYILGLFTVNFNRVTCFIYICTLIYLIFNIFTSPTETSTVNSENAKLEHIDNSILVLCGTVSLFYIILLASKIKNPDINILLVSLILSLMGCLYPTTPKSAMWFRVLRKTDEVFYTLSISFFILYLILNFSVNKSI